VTERIGVRVPGASDLGPAPSNTRPHDSGTTLHRSAVRDGPPSLLQRAASSPPPAGDGESVPPSTPADAAAVAIERGTPPPSPEEVADRVYRLLCEDLRRDRERWGRW
jgi:hypothetical protein